MVRDQPIAIGISGTGFIARQLVRALLRTTDLAIASVLTRREINSVADFPLPQRLTNSIEQFLDRSELIVECTGDPRHATEVVAAALIRQRPVVTMNSEFHVACGSYFADRGYLTEAEGDQPGSLAALAQDCMAMGFKPMVYGSMKRYLDLDPPPDAMSYWAQHLGFTLEQVTSFTDGTKLQTEQALVANGLGAVMYKPGMLGLPGSDRITAQTQLGHFASEIGSPIADYIIDRHLPPGVFVTGLHDDAERETLRTYNLGDGPFYVLERPFHLCGLEVVKTIRRVLREEPPLLNNSPNPVVSVAAVAKRDLPAGYRIDRGMGGFDLRGEAVVAAERRGHLPIGVVFDAVLNNSVSAGEMLCWSDVELPETMAVQIARKIFP
jgi:predicted homoserine dehydrogenase-like protein